MFDCGASSDWNGAPTSGKVQQHTLNAGKDLSEDVEFDQETVDRVPARGW